VKIQNLQMVEY